ncbi:MAG: gamma-glutamyltransferase family protein [candidate division Zixibacteria bacterium]|nr:gamma-glutamyltransferase family protein [candidate division Zixibacteria bacterium]
MSKPLMREFVVIAAIMAVVAVSIIPATLSAQTPERAPVVGTQGMAATAHPLASEAAIAMLKKGGNAIDAAVAAAFAIGVVEPDGSGLGGGGGLIIYLNNTQKSYYINYYHQAPMQIDRISYDSEEDRHTAKAVLVPGTVAGLTTALEKFGTLPLAMVMEPAIRYAEEGFAIDATLAQLLLDNTELLMKHPATSEIFLDEGFPKMEGDILRQPELAATLKRIADHGRNGFYTGPVAETLVRENQELGGVLSLDDLHSYKANVTEPLTGTYRGYDIIGANAPQSGSSIIQALNMLENENLAALGHYSESAATLHLMAETFRRVYTDRWSYLGDPNFNYIPLMGLTSKAYARERFSDINRFKADPHDYRDTQPGNPGRYDTRRHQPETIPDARSEDDEEWDDDSDDDGKSSYEEWGEDLFDSWGGKKTKKKQENTVKTKTRKSAKDSLEFFPETEEEFDGHTTHLSVIDKDGNSVALTQTLGTFFGCGITSAGVLLNCGMSNYSKTSNANLVEPGKQPRSSISPTIVLKDGKPFIVVGSPGASRIICAVTELLVNVIDFGMNAEDANWAPRFYCQKYEDYLYIEGGISEDIQEKLKRMGHTIRAYSGRDLFFGGAQLIYVDPETGWYIGSADRRRGGVAIGY